MKASLQLKNGIYQVIISYKDFDGKHKTKWVSTGMKESTGKRKLEEKRKEILAAFEEEYNRKLYSADFQDGFRPMARYRFADFMDIWLETVKPTLAHTTYIGYAKNIRKIKAYFGNKMYADGLSGNTVKHLHTNLRKALQYAVKTDLIRSNPADKTERPKSEKFVANFYNKDELSELFKVFEGDRMELCVHMPPITDFAEVRCSV